jgi:hypothetical protein
MKKIKSVPDSSKFLFFNRYIDLVKSDDLIFSLKENLLSFTDLINGIPAEKLDYKYAEGKWSIKEVVGHIIDTERIFSYRSLRYARKDATPLPGFDENDFANNSNAGQRNIEDLMDEFIAVRHSTVLLFNSFDDDMLDFQGTGSNISLTARAIGFATLGHCIHHSNILLERYLG